MRKLISLTIICFVLTSCTLVQAQDYSASNAEGIAGTTDVPMANLPNPASAYCEQQGFSLEIRTAEDGSQTGYCVFPDGSECDEWAYFRSECQPADQNNPNTSPTGLPEIMPINPDEYQGWWTYNHTAYGFSIMLPEDWEVKEITTDDPLMNGHMLNLYSDGENIRMTFRKVGEEFLLWPTGVGAGEFVEQGSLEIAGQPARRVYFICPNGVVNAVWYQGSEDSPNIRSGNIEFGFIYSLSDFYCEVGHSLNSKTQRVAEMIIASLKLQ